MILSTILLTAVAYKITEAILLKTNPLVIVHKIVNIDKKILEYINLLKTI